MNLLHGDHTTKLIPAGRVVAAVLVSHDIGTPHTTRMKGRACDLYSFRIIDSWGAITSAE